MSLINQINLIIPWSALRGLGNSTLVKSSAMIPLVGYFIIFNEKLIDTLQMHTNFCAGSHCSVSGKIFFLYFGLCSTAAGSALYALYCPKLIKKYERPQDFFADSRAFYAHPLVLKHLIDELERMTRGTYADPLNFKMTIRLNRSIEADSLHTLSDLMFEFHLGKDYLMFPARMLVGLFYAIGIVLLAIPAISTFQQIFVRFLSYGFFQPLVDAVNLIF